MDENEKPLSPTQLITLLNEVAPDAKCTYCGGPHLNLVTNENELTKYGLFVWGGLKKAMPLYVVGCLTCGHAHFFSKKFVDIMAKKYADRNPGN